jgi:DNA-binding transcriptional LysR family regulator
MEDIGIAFVSQLAVKEEIDSGRLGRVEIKGIPISREFRLIWHKDKYHTALLTSFIELTMRLA